MPLKHNLMTTLHGLVTISELSAGFNLINTGVLKCLIMHQNACKMHHSEAKKSKKNSGRGTTQTSVFWGGAQTPPTRSLRRLDTRAFGARPAPVIAKVLFKLRNILCICDFYACLYHLWRIKIFK